MSPHSFTRRERERRLKESLRDGTVKTAEEEEELAGALCCRARLDRTQLNYPGRNRAEDHVLLVLRVIRAARFIEHEREEHETTASRFKNEPFLKVHSPARSKRGSE